MVIHSELSPAARRILQVCVSVSFKDGKKVELSEELANETAAVLPRLR